MELQTRTETTLINDFWSTHALYRRIPFTIKEMSTEPVATRSLAPFTTSWDWLGPTALLAIFVGCFHSHLQALLTYATVVLLGIYILMEPVGFLEKGLWWVLLKCSRFKSAPPPPLWLRGCAIVLVYGTLTVGSLLFVTSIGPTISTELVQLGQTLPRDLIHTAAAMVHQAEQWAGSPLIGLEAPSLLAHRETVLDEWLTQQATQWTSRVTTQWLTEHPITLESLPQLMQQSFANIGPWVMTVSQAFVWSLLAMMAIFYSLLRAPQWQLTQRFPLLLHGHEVMRGFIRGQVLLGAITGTYMFIVYSLFGVKYALVMAVFFGVVEILPVIGTWLGIIPGLVIAFISGGLWTALGVFACSYTYQTIKDNIVAPKVVGDVMGLHPVVVMASILLWGKIAGVLGVVMAIPITALAWIVWQHYGLGEASEQVSGECENRSSSVSISVVIKTAVLLGVFWLIANILPEVLVLGSVVWLLTVGLGWLIESVEKTLSSLLTLMYQSFRLILPSIPKALPTGIIPTEATHLWLWRLRRVVATAIVLFSVGLMGITLLLHWVPIVSTQWGKLIASIPQLIATIEAALPFPTPISISLQHLTPLTDPIHANFTFSSLLHWLMPLWQPATGVASLLVSTSLASVLWLLLGSVFLAYGLMDAAALRRGLLMLFPRKANFLPVWERMEQRMRLAVPAQWVWAGIGGLASYVLLEMSHVPLAEGLATLFALGYLLPIVGSWFGSVPILLTSSTQGTWAGLFIWLSLVWVLSSLKRHFWLAAWERYAELDVDSGKVEDMVQPSISLSPLWWVAGSALCLEALGPMGIFVIIPFTVTVATLVESFIPVTKDPVS